ncbi:MULTISPECIES: CocE/NonD family hydrolase [Maribacter]|uniref:CocE/NonD family hydrolase n=1 Tax=Maribacter flavus TaxID=1658664 RepID=A0A5B2TMV3_9FLAO|nr:MULTISPECIES: CocE/NonD family hydrolase [Maribacter]KAA2215842.1 CocE/NonD family hydrolase [Maribacter flavus]MDC6406399.1 CocE/NonD family hydrolase [Maribacter sp. PR66]MEE1973519.1 CocE/NonD family hydrolase [Maribacter flavus]
MKSTLKYLLTLFIITSFAYSCKRTNQTTETVEVSDTYVADNYTKKEVDIEMRDGIKLHTTIYSPKDTSIEYPIIMQRTPYSSRPYGEGQFKEAIAPNKHMMKEGYIVVYQDVRGRWLSEGHYENMRAYIPNKKSDQDIDESSDTYDTIEWLVNNVENNNGRVGIWGISYPGFYSTYATVDAHPALKAASPQACIGDFFFDDFHHNGAYLLSYFRATSVFGTPRPNGDQPIDTAWYDLPDLGTEDQYQFFLDAGPLKNLDRFFEYETGDTPRMAMDGQTDDFFWNELKEHPNYDELWQSRGLIQHLKDVKSHVATMIVGGWFDAEDLYGPLETYKNIEKYNKDNYNTMVFGPWDHGGWARSRGKNIVGNYYFGDGISEFFQENIETKFFQHFLKGDGSKNSGLPEAYVFDSGRKEWKQYDTWPPAGAQKQEMYLSENQELTTEKQGESGIEFVSDIKKPVPYSEDIKSVFTPRKYMTDDQRFAARRSDVLVFETDVLTEDLTLAGDIMANLNVATTGTAADWIVKVIDVHPADAENHEEMQDHLKMSNYHLMVRSEVLRGRFRNSFSDPEPFVPNEKTAVNIKLQDVFHTIKKGHKLQIQVQSTWFPLIDLNPQTYVENIFKADETDFKTQTHTVFTDSKIEFTVLP